MLSVGGILWHCLVITLLNCAKEPQFPSYPHTLNVGLFTGSAPDQRTVVIVLRRTDSHVVTDLKFSDVLSDVVDDAGRLGAADVKILVRIRKVAVFIYHVFGLSERGPDAVVVDACVKIRDDDLVIAWFRHGNDLFSECSRRISETFISQRPGVHFFGKRSELRQSAHVKKLGCSGYQLCFLLQ